MTDALLTSLAENLNLLERTPCTPPHPHTHSQRPSEGRLIGDSMRAGGHLSSHQNIAHRRPPASDKFLSRSSGERDLGLAKRDGHWWGEGANQGHLQLSILTGQERTSGGWKDAGEVIRELKGKKVAAAVTVVVERSGRRGCVWVGAE